MPTPPFLGRLLLWLVLPDSDHQSIPGDLHEEYVTRIHPQRGAARAWCWYFGQVVRSAPPMLVMRWRQGELPLALLLALACVAVPMQLLEVLWAFVHSQIPLKADALRNAGILLSNLAILCAGSASAGVFAASIIGRDNGRALGALALLTAMLCALSLATSHASVPLWYRCAVLTLIPACAVAGGRARSYMYLGVAS